MSLDRQIVTDQHAKSILTTMNNLRKSNMLCDITLKVMGESFPAHRIVLAACSDYFCAMFTNEMSEKGKSVIELYDISADVMRELLDFVYTETVDVSVENVQELLPAACLLQLNGVKEACCTFLEQQLDSSNCLGIKIFAESHSCQNLWESAESFSLHHFEDVVKEEEFKTLPLEEVERLIKSDELQLSTEEPVFEAVVDWVKYDIKIRQECLPKLLRYVRLPQLSARYLTDVVDDEALIKRCHECRDLLDEAKKFHLRPDLRTKMVNERTKTRIGSGDMMVVLGGFGSEQNLVNVVEKYDPVAKDWSRLPSLTRRRRYVSAAALNSKLYVIGGYDGQARLSFVECLDMTSEKVFWIIASSMNNRRGLAGCCVYKNHIYVCGGFDGYTRHTSMERYDPKIDEWTLLSGMSVGREGAGLVVADDQMYCIGGYDGINLLDSAEKYNPVTGEWSRIASMSIPRSGAGVAVLNDMIYVCGGYDGTEHLVSVECYNVHLKHWTSLHNMRVPRCYVGACIVHGQLTVVAGYDGNTLLNTVETYDVVSDTWEILKSSMPTPRCDAGVTVLRMPVPHRLQGKSTQKQEHENRVVHLNQNEV